MVGIFRLVGNVLKFTLLLPLFLLSEVLWLIFNSLFIPKLHIPPMLFIFSSLAVTWESAIFFAQNRPELFARFGALFILIAAVSFPLLRFAKSQIDAEMEKIKSQKFSGSESFYADFHINNDLANAQKTARIIMVIIEKPTIYECAFVSIGTLQWGFGDLLVKWFHGVT